MSHEPGPARGTETPARTTSSILLADTDLLEDRVEGTSRSRSRGPLTLRSSAVAQASGQVREIKPKVTGSKYLATALNVWTGPGERFTFLAVLPAGTKVPVTGNVDGPWAEIVRNAKSRWVRAAYLVGQKPRPEPEQEPSSEAAPANETEADVSGISTAPCASGSSVESGLTPDAVRVHRAVCARFPEVTAYGGLRSDGDHSQGLALDIMVPSSSTGDAIAYFARVNSSALGVSEVLWSRQIWTVQRNSEGWRAMEDRGSTIANHEDHVHVTVYGNSGG